MSSAQKPLFNTASRLRQAHHLWHQALNTYDDPDGFTANLNSLIEALRNVTFMLQSEKSAIPHFEEWYPRWQEKMKAHPEMVWLQQARTTVVHKADLVSISIAKVTVFNNRNQFVAEMTVAPESKTEEVGIKVAALFSVSPIPLVLSLERRWVIASFPDREALELLSVVYCFLSAVIREAHAQAHVEFVGSKDGHDVEFSGGKMPCMSAGVEERTVRVSIPDISIRRPERIKVENDESVRHKAARHYGFDREAAKFASPRDIFAYATSLVPMAKQILATDGHHERHFHLRLPNGTMAMYNLVAEDYQDKFLMMRHMAEEVRQSGADAFVEVSEAWVIPTDKHLNIAYPNRSPKKEEVLIISACEKGGPFRSISIPFKRLGKNQIQFGEEVIQDWVHPPDYISAVIEVWS